MTIGKLIEIEKYLNNLLNTQGEVNTSGEHISYTFKTLKNVEIGLYMWEDRKGIFINNLIIGEYFGNINFNSTIQKIISETESYVKDGIERQKEYNGCIFEPFISLKH